MKRKFDEYDMPVDHHEAQSPKAASFDDFGLDPRLLQGVRMEKFVTPTPVQAQAIPIALTGQHILGLPSESERQWPHLLTRCSAGQHRHGQDCRISTVS